MRTLFLTIFLLLSATFALCKEEIHLAPGEETTLELPEPAKSLDFSDADIVTVERGKTKKTIFVRGKRLGESMAEVTLSSGAKLEYVFIVEKSIASLLPLFSQLHGLSASIVHNKIVVKGKITRPDVLARFNALKSRHEGKVIDSTGTELTPQNRIVAKVNALLEENEIRSIKARSYNGILALQGSPTDEHQLRIALRLARSIAPEIEPMINKDSDGNPSLNVEVLFIEVAKFDELNFGFSDKAGPGNLGKMTYEVPTAAARAGGAGINWQVGPLTSFLNAFRKNSAARILSNPKLITRSGSEARFHSGKRVYFGVEDPKEDKDDKRTINVVSIETGIVLKILPHIDAINQINTRVYAEISEVGESQEGALHTVIRSEVDTAVTIFDGQTILLSGLNAQRDEKRVNKIPLLGDIPLLGELFKNRTTRDENKQIVALVTVRKITDAVDSFSKGQEVFEQAESDVKVTFFD